MAYNDKSLKRKKSKKNGQLQIPAVSGSDTSDSPGMAITESLHRLRLQNESPNSLSRRSMSSENSSNSPTLTRKGKKKKADEIEMGIKNVEVLDDTTSIHTVEVLKRPGQTLGFYIKEGNGRSTKGVFISRIAEGSIVQKNGLLKVGDEIQAINATNVTRTNLDDVVVMMSIPKKLVLTIRSSKKRDKNSKPLFADPPRPVFVPRQYTDDTENGYPIDLHTEGSNDSGLSSEHSMRGERRDADYIPPPLNTPYSPVNQEPVYITQTKHNQSDLCVSDGEHEYTPVPRARASKLAHGKREARTSSVDSRRSSKTETYVSDSDLTPGSYSNSLPPPPDEMWNTQFQGDCHAAPATQPHNGFTSEMQHWLRKFDHMSEELNTLPDNHREIRRDSEELNEYRSQLQQQEKMLNHAIYNMESALSVDTMLQQTTQPLAATLPRHSTSASWSQPVQPDSTTPAIANYAYLRDLPLLVKTPMKIRMDDFVIYKPEYNINPNDTSLSNGSMKVKIYCGHGLKSSRTSLRDLYCVVQLDRMKVAKTMIRTGAMNFDWDETFDMTVEEGTGSLLCMIYHWDPHIRHRLCFTGTVRLSNLFNPQSTTPQNHRCALKLEPRGVLYLEIKYCASPADSGRNNTDSLLFGRHLHEVLENEASQTNIPLLVTKCVSEINSRGLDVVGIYRLCGASKKKQQLRSMFEQHPHLVDLSPSSVPEIHAITGLLKDYLRELPDTLLTRQAYDLVEAALTRDTTQDSDVDSHEVVNEFIAKLHPWQQGTVVFLINHLKLISMHQTENRMSTANLALCFGPVFTPPPFTQPEGAGDPSHRDDLDSGKNGLDKGKDTSLRLHIDVLKYLLDIWPQQLSNGN